MLARLKQLVTKAITKTPDAPLAVAKVPDVLAVLGPTPLVDTETTLAAAVEVIVRLEAEQTAIDREHQELVAAIKTAWEQESRITIRSAQVSRPEYLARLRAEVERYCRVNARLLFADKCERSVPHGVLRKRDAVPALEFDDRKASEANVLQQTRLASLLATAAPRFAQLVKLSLTFDVPAILKAYKTGVVTSAELEELGCRVVTPGAVISISPNGVK